MITTKVNGVTVKHNPIDWSVRADKRNQQIKDEVIVKVQQLGGTIANMRDRTREIDAADVREQALRDAMAKKGSQE